MYDASKTVDNVIIKSFKNTPSGARGINHGTNIRTTLGNSKKEPSLKKAFLAIVLLYLFYGQSGILQIIGISMYLALGISLGQLG